MALRLAGEEFSVVQGLDTQGWLREIQANDGDPGLKISQSWAGDAIQFQQAATIATLSGEIRVNPASSQFMLNGGTDIRFGSSARRIVRGIYGANSLDLYASSQPQLVVDDPADGDTGILVRRNVGSTLTLQRVSMGAVDSGGVGFKLLRVPN